jgi:hypothetical protein
MSVHHNIGIPNNDAMVDPYEYLPNWVKLPKPAAPSLYRAFLRAIGLIRDA